MEISQRRKSALFIMGHPWTNNTLEPVSLNQLRQNEAWILGYVHVNGVGDGGAVLIERVGLISPL